MKKSRSSQAQQNNDGSDQIFLVHSTKQALIVDPVLESERVCIRCVNPSLGRGRDLGVPPPGMRIERAVMILKRSDQHELALVALLEEMRRDPPLIDSGRFTSEDLAVLFGITESDIDKIVSWARSHGLESIEVSPSRTFITFSGTLLALECAFRTEFHLCYFATQCYLVNAREVSVPAALAVVIGGLCNLSALTPQRKRAAIETSH